MGKFTKQLFEKGILVLIVEKIKTHGWFQPKSTGTAKRENCRVICETSFEGHCDWSAILTLIADYH